MKNARVAARYGRLSDYQVLLVPSGEVLIDCCTLGEADAYLQTYGTIMSAERQRVVIGLRSASQAAGPLRRVPASPTAGRLARQCVDHTNALASARSQTRKRLAACRTSKSASP